MAGTMTEAINAAAAVEKSKTESLYFIDIVADDIDYLPLLAVLSDKIAAPILIATSKPNYSEDEHHKALDNGAFFYGSYCEDHEKNIKGVRVTVNNYHRLKKSKESTGILSCGNLLVLLEHKMVFCDDLEISFTSKEYDTLRYLLEHRNMTVSNKQMSHEIWGGKFVSGESIRQVIDRLRKKLLDADLRGAEIANYKGLGYRLQA
jgi:DNA-binding response OmpR family regulator